ncbi:hypothetical protein PAHAL_6G055400 [Panicum hallii]|uniref:Uncharacterized protein n=1 Tax=Panicum hallii TaxID=206008 RepID=A0A2T8IFA6_9POAL|nr:hypothetical protein PAHAL_6G055400 [Panicum hallii]
MVFYHQVKTHSGNDSDSMFNLLSGGGGGGVSCTTRHGPGSSADPCIKGLSEFMNKVAMQLWLPSCIAAQ